MSKYEVLLRILDELRNEAPKEFKRYHPEDKDKEKVNQARARAYIHLFLKGRYGVCNFADRERHVTDDAYDGGIDAYYIDYENKEICFIQSKFRTNESNFKEKEIDLDELLNMDIGRIIDGETTDEDGNSYNSKILEMIREIRKIEDIARYNYKVVILANLKKYRDSDVRRFVGGFYIEIYNFEKCYRDLVFPLVAGCYFKPEEITINLSLDNKDGNEGRIGYTVNTELSDCKIIVTFVPLVEIGKILYKYQNAVLRYNPRCFLGLKNNVVNPKIEKTVRTISTNEFALFNNGITILSDQTDINSRISVKDKAQMIIKNPQIINGGQTSFTLASIYKECVENEDYSVFDNKEVLVKVITFLDRELKEDESKEDKQQKKLRLIEDLSRATNEQSEVSEVDRRSNESVMVNYQAHIFDEFGYFLNRKEGEFYEGLNKNYISRDMVIESTILMRVGLSVNGNATKARRTGDSILFREANFASVFHDTNIYRKYVFGYMCYQLLVEEEKNCAQTADNKFGIKDYGNALRYGKYAVVCIASRAYKEELEPQNYSRVAKEAVKFTLSKWKSFEAEISKKKVNSDYFYKVRENGVENYYYNFDGYYKGATLNEDLEQFNIAFE